MSEAVDKMLARGFGATIAERRAGDSVWAITLNGEPINAPASCDLPAYVVSPRPERRPDMSYAATDRGAVANWLRTKHGASVFADAWPRYVL